MKFLFDFAQLELVKRENLQSLLDDIQLGNEVEIEVDAIEFPDKIRVALHLTFEGGWYSCSFPVFWDDEKLSYCGLSKEFEENLEIALSPPRTNDKVIELFSKLSQKSFP